MQTFEKLSKRFWYMTPVEETDRPILGVVVGNERTLMIDAGNSDAHAQSFLQELSNQGIPSPEIVVITHWHWDHIFGLSSLQPAVSISSKQTKSEMEKLLPLSWTNEALDERVKQGREIEFCASAIKKEFPTEREVEISLPCMTFEDRIEIDLGEVTCILQHVGGDHAGDSVIVYVKEEKILFLADCIYPDIFSGKWNYTIQGTRKLLDKLAKFDAETYILSHWKPITKKEFEDEVKLLRSVGDLTEAYSADQQLMTDAYKKQVGRNLTEDELETIQYFVNGFDRKDTP